MYALEMDNFGNKDKKRRILVRKHTNISRNNINMGLSWRQYECITKRQRWFLRNHSGLPVCPKKGIISQFSSPCHQIAWTSFPSDIAQKDRFKAVISNNICTNNPEEQSLRADFDLEAGK